MHLKSVRIFGFKTFAERTEFSLDGGIVAVIGPNGCGKSNLVDAILWGLGEGSARQLRAQTGQDVIFGGSARRKPIGFAEVSLLFENSDRALPIDSEEVSISRRINRSGESEYAINRQPCRLKDVHDLLADSGLGRAGYSIVGQREIDEALSATPEERRAWVDEAAGVQRYRQKKVESQRRLTAAKDHLQRVNDILTELEDQREPLRAEAEIAIRYKSVLTSLREVETSLLVVEVAKAVRDIATLEEKISNSSRIVREELDRADQLDNDARLSLRQDAELETEAEQLRRELQSAISRAERAVAEIRLGEERLKGLDEIEASLTAVDNQAARADSAEEEIFSLRSEFESEKQTLEALQSEAAGAGSDIRPMREALANLDKEIASARTAMAEHMKQEAEARHRSERIREVKREIAGIDEGLPELEKGADEACAESDRLSEALKESKGKITLVEAELAEHRLSEEQDAAEQRKLMAERSALEGRRSGIESTIEAHEGLAQGSRAVLEALDRKDLDGDYLPVGQAIETPKHLALAIETALGASAGDLIVDHDSDAKRAIAFLKDRRLGRATFQPIPLMRPSEVGSDLRRLLNEKGIVGRASELVSCTTKHRPVIDSLLGRVVIVEDLDTALKHARTTGWRSLVTLTGEIVHGSGAVTGGLSSRQGYGLVQRKADLTEVLNKLEEIVSRLDDGEKRAAVRTQRRESLQASITDLRKGFSEREEEAEEARQFAKALADELLTTQRSRQKLEGELERMSGQTAVGKLDVNVEALEAKRDQALHDLAARSADAEQVETRLRECETRLHQSEARLRSAERRLEGLRDDEQRRGKKLAQLEPERKAIREAMAAESAKQETAEKDRAALSKRLEQLQETRSLMARERELLNDEAKDARANAQTVGDAAHHAELDRARTDSRRTAALQRLLEEYGIGEDEALEQEPVADLPPDAAQLVSKLRRELKTMGDVNIGAIEAFERLSVRFDERTTQQADILEGIDQVEASIKELDKLSRERFVQTYEKLQEAFSELIQKMFSGGEGRLGLTQPDAILDSGIELDVTLPGKRRQRLELLSGGERSLCAASFLFALLRVKPSPLVVLDEVDAPLDGRNVERFVDVLREFSQNIQFIVITHNPTTIQAAPVWLGVTMQEPGVSFLAPTRIAQSAATVA